jgi:hypothetical protein
MDSEGERGEGKTEDGETGDGKTGRRGDGSKRREELRREATRNYRLVIPAQAGIQRPFLMETSKHTGFRLAPE